MSQTKVEDETFFQAYCREKSIPEAAASSIREVFPKIKPQELVSGNGMSYPDVSTRLSKHFGIPYGVVLTALGTLGLDEEIVETRKRFSFEEQFGIGQLFASKESSLMNIATSLSREVTGK